MRKRFSLVLSLMLLSSLVSCTIKPPDDDGDLGPEVSGQEVNNAKADAQAGYTIDQAFRVNDTGTVQIVDTVFGNGAVRSTFDYHVTVINSEGVYFTESVRETGQVGQGLITPASWSAGQSAAINRTLKFFAALPDPFADIVSDSFLSLTHFFASVRVETSQALGQVTKPIPSSPTRTGILEQKLRKNIKALFGTGLSAAGLRTGVSDISPTPSPSPGQSPTPTPAPTPSEEPCQDPTVSKCYGLHVFKHSMVTPNCSQIPDCKVKSTHIDFNEIKKQLVKNGDKQELQDVRFHWAYEISTEVPGLFVFMDQCFSTLVSQNGQQIPLTECAAVSDFSFGGGH